MFYPVRSINTVTDAHRIQTVLSAGMQLTRHLYRTDHTVVAKRSHANPREFGIDEAKIKGGIVRDQWRITQKIDQRGGPLGKARLVRQKTDGQTMHGLGFKRHVTLWVEISVEVAPGLAAINKFDAAYFDEPVPAAWIETCCFCIENYFTH